MREKSKNGPCLVLMFIIVAILTACSNVSSDEIPTLPTSAASALVTNTTIPVQPTQTPEQNDQARSILGRIIPHTIEEIAAYPTAALLVITVRYAGNSTLGQELQRTQTELMNAACSLRTQGFAGWTISFDILITLVYQSGETREASGLFIEWEAETIRSLDCFNTYAINPWEVADEMNVNPVVSEAWDAVTAPVPTERPSYSSRGSGLTSSVIRRPANCTEALAMGLSAREAARWSHLDRDGDGVACYGD